MVSPDARTCEMRGRSRYLAMEGAERRFLLEVCVKRDRRTGRAPTARRPLQEKLHRLSLWRCRLGFATLFFGIRSGNKSGGRSCLDRVHFSLTPSVP